jgi:hypothetical protein
VSFESSAALARLAPFLGQPLMGNGAGYEEIKPLSHEPWRAFAV